MSYNEIKSVAVRIWFPTLCDWNAFDQQKIFSIIDNAKTKNTALVNQENIFDLLVDAVQWIPKEDIYTHWFKRAVIGHVRNKIVELFDL